MVNRKVRNVEHLEELAAHAKVEINSAGDNRCRSLFQRFNYAEITVSHETIVKSRPDNITFAW